MAPDNVPHNSAEQPEATSIPVQVDDIDRLIAIARNLDGLVLILGAAAVGNPAFEAVDSILRPIHEQLQDFKNWFNHAWQMATSGTQ